MSDQDPEGRVYQLRPRHLPPQPPAGRVIPFERARPPSSSMATVHAFPRSKWARDVEVSERTLDARSVLDWAWAAHQRVYAGVGEHLSYREVVTGAERGRAAELFTSRVAVRALPDCEEWMETLQLDGRAVLHAFESTSAFTPAPDGHVCDCTCEGGPEHARWELLPAEWRPVRVGALLQKLARGFRVKVRLAPR